MSLTSSYSKQIAVSKELLQKWKRMTLFVATADKDKSIQIVYIVKLNFRKISLLDHNYVHVTGTMY